MHGNSLVIRTDTPCASCTWFDGWDASGHHALCTNRECCRVRTQPERGCVRYEREPGSDDELLEAPAFAAVLVSRDAPKPPVAWAP